MAGVVANGGVDEHLAGLVRLGLLESAPTPVGTWLPVCPHTPLALGVRKVLKALGSTPDEPPRRPARPLVPSRGVAIKTLTAAEQAVRDAAQQLKPDVAVEVLALLQKARQRLEA